MSFPAACLSIGEDGPVVAIQDVLYGFFSNKIVNFKLLRVWLEDSIEGKDEILWHNCNVIVCREDGTFRTDSTRSQFLEKLNN